MTRSTTTPRPAITRRDFMALAGRYGLSSTLFAMGGAVGLADVARAAESGYERRFSKAARHTLRFGAAGLNTRNLLIERAGSIEFARDLESRTDGEIRVEFLGDERACRQTSCVEKALQGIVDIYTASTQNSAVAAPYLNVLDYAYMFPSRAALYHFLYSPASMALLRNPLEQRHGLKFLFSHCELRGLQLGLGWADRPTVSTLDELAGTTNRVTGTQLGRITMRALNLNPVPMAWEETLEGLRSGLIDGAETWASAVAYGGLAPVVSQSVDLRFCAGTEHTAMSASVFDALSGELQDAVMESAYWTQAYIQGANEASLLNTVGFSDPPMPGTVFAQDDVRVATLGAEEIAKAEEMSSPASQPQLWEPWRERLNAWSGGFDTYREIHDVAREIPADTLAENVEPRRWWRG
ncbi:TRAP transporter substrate-binding protein [Oceaniglobus trochenteri]|uniref:TRAP transporter substrate-binding protein n=1 Tax=Oceaniglobus trochenteri TaxID=2763260 RepID=UPI001CFFA042|nr:TRAP transporter substrate-binding protein DctP [Oceaniglobus trochenteri]